MIHSFSVQKKTVRRILWFLIPCVFFLGAYGMLPLILETVAEQLLAQYGFSEVKVTMGHPGWRQTVVQNLSFSKEVGGDRWNLTLDNLLFDYHPSELIDGHLQRLGIHDAVLTIIPKETQPIPVDDSGTSPEPSLIPPLTVGKLLAPLPVLPLSHLVLVRLAIHQPHAPPQFQHMEIAGAWHDLGGTLNGTLTIQGPHIPSHHLAFTGTGIGNMRVSLHKDGSAEHPILHLQSQLTPDDTHFDLQGSIEADIHQLLPFLSMFRSLPPSLSEATGMFQADWHSRVSPEMSLATLTTDKVPTIEGSWRTRLSLPRLLTFGSNFSANLQGTISGNGSHLDWTLSPDSRLSADLHLDALHPPKPLQAVFPELHPHLLVDFPQSITAHLAFTHLAPPETPQVTLDGPIRIRYGTNTSPLAFKLALSQLSGHLLGNRRARGALAMSALWRGPAQAFLPVHKARIDLSGDVSVDEDTLRITLFSPSILKAGLVQQQDITVPLAQFTLQQPTTLVYQMRPQSWRLDQTQVTIQAPLVRWKTQTLTTERLGLTLDHLQGKPSSWRAEGHLAVEGVRTTIAGLSPPDTNWDLQFVAESDGVWADLRGRTRDGNVSVSGRLEHDRLTQKGSFNLALSPIKFSPSTVTAGNLLQPWPYPLDLTTGAISGTAHLSWDLQGTPHTPTLTRADLRLSMNDVGGYLHTLLFEGATADIHLTGIDPWKTREPTTFRIQRVLSGITVSNIAMKLDAEGHRAAGLSRLDVREFSATVFGGRVASEHIIFDQNLQTKPFVLTLEQLDIGHILALEQQKGLQGTGLLDGRIPLTLGPNGLDVQHGSLEARAPGGVIRFQPGPGTAEALAHSNTNMNLVLNALRNFEYEHLSIEVDYGTDGTLKLGIRLQGKNPEFQKGRPINFNLTVEENIPALLKTLRIAQGLEQQIGRLLKRGKLEVKSKKGDVRRKALGGRRKAGVVKS